MHACCPVGPGSMACATACSVCAVELASRACGAQCSAKSAPMVPGDLAVCHRLLAGCGETMGGLRPSARRPPSRVPANRRRASPCVRCRQAHGAAPSSTLNLRLSTTLPPQLRSPKKITRGFRGGKPCRKRLRKRCALFVSTGGFSVFAGLWKTISVHHKWFFANNKTQYIVPKWRIVSTSRNAAARAAVAEFHEISERADQKAFSFLRAWFWKLEEGCECDEDH